VESAEPVDQYASTDDLRQAIGALTEQDLLRLRDEARVHLLGTEYRDPQDLINEVVKRAMNAALGQEGRRWPKSRVPFMAFIIETMKALATDNRRSAHKRRTSYLADRVPESLDENLAIDELGYAHPSAEAVIIEEEESQEAAARVAADVAKLEMHFAKDDGVSSLLLSARDGMNAGATQECWGWSSTQYETIRKRLRRGLSKLFPGRRGRD
jgi:hypothetical protein